MSTLLLSLKDAFRKYLVLDISHGGEGLKLEIMKGDTVVGVFYIRHEDNEKLINAIYHVSV